MSKIQNNLEIEKGFIHFKVPAEVSLKQSEIEANRTYSEFYAGCGSLLSLSSGSRLVEVVPEGELGVYFDDDYFKNGMASKELISRGLFDEDVQKLSQEDQFGNCNWFNIRISDESNQFLDTETVLSTIDEAFEAALELVLLSTDDWQAETAQCC